MKLLVFIYASLCFSVLAFMLTVWMIVDRGWGEGWRVFGIGLYSLLIVLNSINFVRLKTNHP